MQPVISSLTFEQLRQAKKNASKSLESLGIELSSSTIGNHVAMMFGYHDWNIASAITKTPPDYKLPSEVFLSRRTSQIEPNADFESSGNHSIGLQDINHKAKSKIILSKLLRNGYTLDEAEDISHCIIYIGEDDHFLPTKEKFESAGKAIGVVLFMHHCRIFNYYLEKSKADYIFKDLDFNKYINIRSNNINGEGMMHYTSIGDDWLGRTRQYDKKLLVMLDITAEELAVAQKEYLANVNEKEIVNPISTQN